MQAVGTREERRTSPVILLGLLITLSGCVVSLLSLGMVSGNGARLVMVIAGIAISLFGIFGVLNQHYLKNAIWKSEVR
jgi:cytochrome c biogenesis protein CcdA